ncbi:hypothetical protein E2C01_050043 [Portunus trituberculatus]|uniref:Uncharacterized protein n=1 Tax=Portunus trituberculatus TaxID=210409 RepID=A0A5B7G7X7_PORTR|nr:hypothetical protein [Portunus trituberculatus]
MRFANNYTSREIKAALASPEFLLLFHVLRSEARGCSGFLLGAPVGCRTPSVAVTIHNEYQIGKDSKVCLVRKLVRAAAAFWAHVLSVKSVCLVQQQHEVLQVVRLV